MNDLRIVLLGKTGVGKSSTGNTILGKIKFCAEVSPNSITGSCKSETKRINGRKITVVDTPGFFDTSLSEKELKGEIVRCITECAPGPHAFLIVLRLDDRFTKQEKEVVKEITDSFGEEALKYAVVLFTHGDQLAENQTIQDFLKMKTDLKELVEKCGGVHVIDNNKYWMEKIVKKRNRVQVEELLNTIEEMVKENGGQCYTNKMLQKVQKGIEKEMNKPGKEGSERDRTEQAKQNVYENLMKLVKLGTTTLLGALLGATYYVNLFLKEWEALSDTISVIDQAANLLGATSEAAECSKKLKAFGVAASAVVGGVAGGVKGYDAEEGAETITEAIKQAASATYDGAKDVEQKKKKNLQNYMKMATSAILNNLQYRHFHKGHILNICKLLNCVVFPEFCYFLLNESSLNFKKKILVFILQSLVPHQTPL